MLSETARRVAASARRRDLFATGDTILVAVSGGADSVALLYLLSELAPSSNLTLLVMHIDHGLRGEESEEDARFVAALCDRLGFPLTRERVELAAGLDRLKGRSIQEMAREARYAALLRVAGGVGAGKIAVGHTADDQAETLLMWMLRGAGAAGLAGIPPVRDQRIIRPLLELSRTEVLEYLRTRGVTFRTDSSNATLRYARNRVRHELVPVLKRFNPAVLETLVRQADLLREEDACLEQMASEALLTIAQKRAGGELSLDRASLLALPVALQRRVVRAVLRWTTGTVQGPSFGAVAAVLDRVVHGRSGSSLDVRGAIIEREYERIRVRLRRPASRRASQMPAASDTEALAVAVPSAVEWPPTGQAVRIRVDHPPSPIADGSTGGHTAVFDADRMTWNLTLRSWQPGDAFHPLGMQGRRKKLQDYFADLKLPREERRRVPLLVAPEGILWIVGYRTDDRFRPTSSTRRLLLAELLSGTSHRGS